MGTPRRVATMTVYDSIERGAADECEPLRGRRPRTFTLTQLLVACGAVCVCAVGATTVVKTHLANFDEDYPGGAQLGQPKPELMNFDEEKNLEGKPSRIDCQADLKKAVAALADLHSKAEGVLHEMHYSVLPERLQPGHEHDLVGCEKVCEGHGYDKDTCDGMKGCHFDEHDQQCFSAVGQEDCDHADQPEEPEEPEHEEPEPEEPEKPETEEPEKPETEEPEPEKPDYPNLGAWARPKGDWASCPTKQNSECRKGNCNRTTRHGNYK